MTDAMRNVPENELFSAYVDGELTAAEQAEVERLLAASPAARQLVDDLRSLSSTLQGLPLEKLDVDLSQEVLRLAERRILSGEGDADEDLEVPGGAAKWRAFVRRWSRPRIWIWPGVAVAVSVLLVVLQPEQGRRWDRAPGEKTVALAPTAREPAQPPAIGPRVEKDADRLAEKRGIGPSEGQAEAEKPDPAAESLRMAAKVPMLKSAGVGTAPKAEAPEIAAGARKDAPPAPMAAVRMQASSAPAEQPRPAKADLDHTAEKASAEVTIVYCDVAPQAVAFVEQVLAKREIAVLAAAGLQRERKQAANGQLAQARSAMRAEDENGTNSGEAKPAGKSRDKARAIHSRDLVYLHAEATTRQLEAVLADLRSQPELVRSLVQSQFTGPNAEGEVERLLADEALSDLKPKGGPPAGESPGIPMARRAKKVESETGGPVKRFQAPVQDRPAEAPSAGAAQRSLSSRSAQRPPVVAEAASSDAAPSDRQTHVQSQSGVAARQEQTQNMGRPAPQKVVEATPAPGIQAASQPTKPEAAKDSQSPRQAVEGSARRGVEPAVSDEIKRRVVFVLRPMGDLPLAAEAENPPPPAATMKTPTVPKRTESKPQNEPRSSSR